MEYRHEEVRLATTKFAISVPSEVMDAVDEAARERGITRSRFIATVLDRVARARTDQAISRRIDEVLADPEIAKEQRTTAADYRRIRPRAGTEW